jgi:hypothetical protein
VLSSHPDPLLSRASEPMWTGLGGLRQVESMPMQVEHGQPEAVASLHLYPDGRVEFAHLPAAAVLDVLLTFDAAVGERLQKIRGTDEESAADLT